MPRRLLFALLVLVAAPLALLGWLSASTYRQQQETARQQLQLVYQSRLAEIDRSLAYVIDSYSRELDVAVARSQDTVETLRWLDQDSPIVRTTLLVDKRGILVYPPRPTTDAPEPVALYASLPAIIDSRPDLMQRGVSDEVNHEAGASGGRIKKKVGPLSASKRETAVVKSLTGQPNRESSESTGQPPQKWMASQRGNIAASAPSRSGDGRWQTWYMDEGLQLIYWIPRQEIASIGVLLERARWVSDLTAALPDSTPLRSSFGRPILAAGATALVDESGELVYRWGDDHPLSDAPLATHSLSPPLTSWQLEYHGTDPLPGSASTAMVASLTGIGVVLLALGAYVLTGVQRQMRTARRRVGFASQVSHELRTPLTNIRLYAELAESDVSKLPESDSRKSIQRRLEVIDNESRRLGRLVSGVLEMIRDDRKRQGPRISDTIPDKVIEQALKQFEPSFQKATLVIHRELNADRVVGLDADILEMVLVNLLSNVEKYAGSGEFVRVSSRMEDSLLVVRVADDGPGIAWRHRANIFRPFSRLDDSINAPSGTGIGLTIAKRLARRHGGELKLVASDVGACFELRLPMTPVADSGAEIAEAGER